jgi:hypothetical protein
MQLNIREKQDWEAASTFSGRLWLRFFLIMSVLSAGRRFVLRLCLHLESTKNKLSLIQASSYNASPDPTYQYEIQSGART